MALMKLVDLSSQIRAELAATKTISGTSGAMHIAFTTEGGVKKVVAVPLQMGPSVVDATGASVYGTPLWGPTPDDIRSENYHDPKVPGTTETDTDGTVYVWVQDQGFVPAAGDVATKAGVESVKGAGLGALLAAAKAYCAGQGHK
jgi:hypothetical protein